MLKYVRTGMHYGLDAQTPHINNQLMARANIMCHPSSLFKFIEGWKFNPKLNERVE